MSEAARLSVCYVVPGHNLLSSAGPTRNVLSVARAMSMEAEVAVAFRRTLEPIEPADYSVLEIDAGAGGSDPVVDDAAVRGVGYREFARYVGSLRRFTTEHLARFDVVLEKSWFLSGYLSRLCWRRGIPAIPVENIVPVLGRVQRRDPLTTARHHIGRALAGHYLRKAPVIIAETEPLKNAITSRWRASPERVRVIELGVDRSLFRPADPVAARRQVGISLQATVLLYTGVLDRIHNLEPVLEALALEANGTVELHIVGDGTLRERYERLAARSPGRVFFHGRVPHRCVPAYIAAADLCLAPYDPETFPHGEIGYSTLKVPEYLSVGRPVAGAPSGRVAELVRHGVSGFLFDNDVAGWRDFLRDPPSREQLERMGEAARAVRLRSWEDTAREYLGVCREQVSAVHRRRFGA